MKENLKVDAREDDLGGDEVMSRDKERDLNMVKGR